MSSPTTPSSPASFPTIDVLAELSEAQFGDKRLAKRCLRIAEAMQHSPGASLPDILGSDTALTGAYRFFNNPDVHLGDFLHPHAEATVGRIPGTGDWLCVYDTTEMEYRGTRTGLGRLNGSRRGFLAHVALALTADKHALPLGVLGVQTLVRKDKPRKRKIPKSAKKSKKGTPKAHTVRQGTKSRERKKKDSSKERKKKDSSKERRGKTYSLDPEVNEGALWEAGIADVERRLPSDGRRIDVVDRGGDSYLQLDRMVANNRRFVTRLNHDRGLDAEQADDATLISKALAGRPILAERDILISARNPKVKAPDSLRKQPPRKERAAHVVFTSARVVIKRPHGAPASLPERIVLNVVRVSEPDPPPGAEPVEWRLATSEPIDTAADLERVVDIYRSRWVIEEFFKALKSGCAVLDREFENCAALMNVLGISIPMAVQMLGLRSLARASSTAPATAVLSETQVEILVEVARPLPPRQRPPENPTARQALLAIAALGGHVTRNGEPGWLTISRGFHKIREIELRLELCVAIAARRAKRCVGS